MGQVLSLPMLLIGGALLTYAYSARVPSGNVAAGSAKLLADHPTDVSENAGQPGGRG
jgi:hypothetical protein